MLGGASIWIELVDKYVVQHAYCSRTFSVSQKPKPRYPLSSAWHKGGGSLLCKQCTFEKNFFGVDIAGRATCRVEGCTFRTNHVAIYRAHDELSVDDVDNVYECNKMDRGTKKSE